MAAEDVKISALPSATSLTGVEIVPVVQGVGTEKTTVRTSAQNIADLSIGKVASVNGEVGIVVLTTDDIGSGTTTKQFTADEKIKLATIGADANVTSINGQTGVAVLDTDDVAEGGANQYFTQARAIAAPLTGFSAVAGTISASDTILQAFGKVVGNAAASFPIKNVTASRALISSDNRALLQNIGASAEVNYTAPTGLQSPAFACQIANVDSDGSKFTVPAGAVVYFGGQVSSDGGSISTTTIGAVLNVSQVSATIWIVTGATGDWTIS